MDANERNPGDAEAVAAIFGLQEIYGDRFEVGDTVRFRRHWWPSGMTASGRIQQIGESGWLVEMEGDVGFVGHSELVAV